MVKLTRSNVIGTWAYAVRESLNPDWLVLCDVLETPRCVFAVCRLTRRKSSAALNTCGGATAGCEEPCRAGAIAVPHTTVF